MSDSLRDASTVILLREWGSGFEVLLQRRNRGMAFMGGAYVFPGGKVDSSDAAFMEYASEDVVRRCTSSPQTQCARGPRA